MMMQDFYQRQNFFWRAHGAANLRTPDDRSSLVMFRAVTAAARLGRASQSPMTPFAARPIAGARAARPNTRVVSKRLMGGGGNNHGPGSTPHFHINPWHKHGVSPSSHVPPPPPRRPLPSFPASPHGAAQTSTLRGLRRHSLSISR